jgi:hypothetical protein
MNPAMQSRQTATTNQRAGLCRRRGGKYRGPPWYGGIGRTGNIGGAGGPGGEIGGSGRVGT